MHLISPGIYFLRRVRRAKLQFQQQLNRDSVAAVLGRELQRCHARQDVDLQHVPGSAGHFSEALKLR